MKTLLSFLMFAAMGTLLVSFGAMVITVIITLITNPYFWIVLGGFAVIGAIIND